MTPWGWLRRTSTDDGEGGAEVFHRATPVSAARQRIRAPPTRFLITGLGISVVEGGWR